MLNSASARLFSRRTALAGTRPFSTGFDEKKRPLMVKSHGVNIIHDSLYNKGMAFDDAERERLGLRGLLPAANFPFDTQISRVMKNLRAIDSDTQKNLYLQDLHNRNETLYHRVLCDNIEEVAPLVYTPTIGQACLDYGSQFTRPRGMYFSSKDRGNFSQMIYNWPHTDVRVIVVTDGSRILGLGDLGAHGMGIPVGKLALYCAAGGIAPHRVLPVMLDAGCNNPEVRDDEFYLGMKHDRLEGDEYYDMVEEFIQAVYGRYRSGQLMIQFEDFRNEYAQPLLDKYRDRILCFNDDIQGTGVITTSSVIGALRMQGLPPTALADQKIVIMGAGSSGLGVATQLAEACEHMGVKSAAEARKNFYVCSSLGLIGAAGGDDEYGSPNHARGMGEDRTMWMRDDLPDGMPLDKIVKAIKPDILLGLSTTGGIFTDEIMKEMASHVERPIIFPLSNPTAKSECTAKEAYQATDGRVIFSSGSPFPTLPLADGSEAVFSQCNNMFIFPGVGLGATVVGAKSVTDKMLFRAAKACAEAVTPEETSRGQTLPTLSRIREVSLDVATAVAEEAMADGCVKPISGDTAAVRAEIKKKMYDPVYVPLVENVYR